MQISAKNCLKSIPSDVSIHEYRIKIYIFPFSVSLFPYVGDEYMSLDIAFDTILLVVATIIQSDRMRISAKSSSKSI